MIEGTRCGGTGRPVGMARVVTGSDSTASYRHRHLPPEKAAELNARFQSSVRSFTYPVVGFTCIEIGTRQPVNHQFRIVIIAGGAFMRHAQFLHHPLRSEVSRKSQRDNLMQPKRFKAITQRRMSGFGGEALTPARFGK